MAAVLHRAPRTDRLARALGDLLATPPDAPFATEAVVVPARGVERWLAQRLSHRLGAAPGRDDGVCAGVDLRSGTGCGSPPGKVGSRRRSSLRHRTHGKGHRRPALASEVELTTATEAALIQKECCTDR